MWVVKLGGSLDGAGTLSEWANVLARSPHPLVVCPGGGPFADQVRAAQGRWPINDATAHRMAILAMEQSAHLLRGLCPSLIPVVDTGALGIATPPQGRFVWFPAAELLDDPDIPHSWDLTSDSIAALLARRIGASGLVLVKSFPLADGPMTVEALQDAGVLDGVFHEYGSRSGCSVWLLRGDNSGEFHRLMQGGFDRRLSFAQRLC